LQPFSSDYPDFFLLSSCFVSISSYTPRPKKEYRTIYLSQLKQWIDVGRIDPTKKITMKVLRDSGIVRRNLVDGVTLIARVRIRIPPDFFFSFWSQEGLDRG
jgi:hypothetical protein